MSESPYPGLKPFERDETDIFFGRDNQTDALVALLEQARFLAVLGESGCGKSSLVRNGLLSALDAGFMASAGSYWSAIIMRPGTRPFANLAGQLLRDPVFAESYSLMRGDALLARGILEAELCRGPLSMHEILAANPLPEETRLHLVVDQFEELFRYQPAGVGDRAEAFIEFLLQARQHPQVYVTITMRSEFLGNCTHYTGLPEAISRGLYLTPRLNRDEMSEAIGLPARVFGGQVEASLVNRLLNEAGSDRQDQLPLLQHALMRMWSLDEDKTLTLDEYLDFGGLAETLSSHLDSAYQELDQRQQQIAEAMFRRLIDQHAELQDTRSPTPVAEIMAVAEAGLDEVAAVVDVFRKPGRCFLTPPAEVELDANDIIDISHESLIRQWKRLRAWNASESRRAEVYRRLAGAALRWFRRTGELWRGVDLQQAIDWKASFPPTREWALRYNSEPGFDFELAMKFLAASEERQRRVTEERRRQRQARYRRLVFTAFGLVLLLLCGIAGGMTWFMLYEWEHDTWFASYTKQWGLPVGITPLESDQVEHRQVSFKLTRRGILNPIDSIEAVDNRGRCTTSHDVATYITNYEETDDRRRACRWEFVRNSQGEVVFEKGFDKRGVLVWGLIYTPHQGSGGIESARQSRALFVGDNGYVRPQLNSRANSLRFEYTSQGFEGVIWYTDLTGTPALGPDRQLGQNREYDSSGRVLRITSLDGDGNPMADAVGNASLALDYNDDGQLWQTRALDVDEMPATTNFGYSTSRRKYNEFGNLAEVSYFDQDGKPVIVNDGYHRLEYRYNDDGNVSDYYYFDGAGEPVYAFKGYHHSAVTYDDAYNPVEVTYLDENGQPAVSKNGYARFRQTFDARGNLLRYEYFDEAFEPTLGREGFARAEYQYDDNGNRISGAFFDADETPTTLEAGYSSWRAIYNAINKQVEKRYFDSAANPVPIDGGYAIIRNSYDRFGNTLSGAYFDVAEQAVLSRDGYAGWNNQFDRNGNVTETSYFGVDGRPIAGKSGYAGWRMLYDDRGNRVRESYFDINGASLVLADGYAIVELGYDAAGNQVESRYLDADGQLITLKEKYAIWRAAFDAGGNEIERNFYNLNNQLVKTAWGYARVRTRFDNRGNPLRRSYHDVYDRLVLNQDWYASKIDSYDRRGNNIETRYLGINGEAVQLLSDDDDFANGYHRIRREFDKFGQPLRIAYFGANDEPQQSDRGYAGYNLVYDRFGNEIEVDYFDRDNKPEMIVPGGYQRVARGYDQQGRVNSERYFARHGVPVEREEGYHEVRREYDHRGLMLREYYLDQIRNPVNTERGCADWRYSYDSRGQVTVVRSLDEDGQSCVTRDGYAIARYSYDRWSQNTGIAVFDALDRPATHVSGWHRWSDELDAAGNVVHRVYFGADQNPLELGIGYASWRAEYNRYGNVVATRYYGAGGMPVTHAQYRYHGFEQKFNDRQQLIEVTVFDTDGFPVVANGNYARYTQAYDDYGNLVEVATYDAEGRRIVNDFGYAIMRRGYDERGNLVEETYTDEHKRFIEVDGCARQRWEYDDNGLLIDRFCL